MISWDKQFGKLSYAMVSWDTQFGKLKLTSV